MPAKKSNSLSPAFVRTVKSHGAYGDGNGLTLLVDNSGKRWIQRVTINGRRRNIGLGGFPAVSLAKARDQATANAKAIRDGLDPILEKRRARELALKPTIPAFAEAAKRVIDARRPTWRNHKPCPVLDTGTPLSGAAPWKPMPIQKPETRPSTR